MVTVVCNIILAPVFIFHFDWGYPRRGNGNGHFAIHRYDMGGEPFPAKDKHRTFATGVSGR